MSRPTLYIISLAPSGNPLDCVGDAAALLAEQYEAVHLVGPAQTMSSRAMRRQFRPARDRVLYDLTAPGDGNWALDLLAQWPGAVLRSSRHLPVTDGVLADLRSVRRYASGGFRFSPVVTIGELDAVAGDQAAMTLRRPAVTITALSDAHDIALAVAPGAIETAYSALLGLVSTEKPLVAFAVTRRDANDLSDMINALDLRDAHVRYLRNRNEIARSAAALSGLIDAGDADGRMSDLAFVARCIGAPVLSLTTPSGAGEAAKAFVSNGPQRDAAAARHFRATRSLQAFADDLHTLIEAGYRRALQPSAA